MAEELAFEREGWAQAALDSGSLATTRVDLPGTTNVRDLGGLPAAGGSVVASGRLFRGEVLTSPGSDVRQGVWDGADGRAFRALGLRTIVDLRSEGEVSRTASAWQCASGAETVLSFPIPEGGEGSDTNYMRLLLSGEMAGFGVAEMTAFYLGVLVRRAGVLGAAVTALAQSAALPALVHCSAGKDRTGILVALVLDLVGTPRELVVEDYALTGVLRPNRVESFASLFHDVGVDPEVARVLFETPAASMEAVLEWVDSAYGSTERYLVEAAGVPPEVPQRLRNALTVPVDHSASRTRGVTDE